jgi:hypothetical protein
VDAYHPAGWAAVFAAIAGASAGLTGLLFVALSINLSRVLKQPGWIGRAVEVLVLLTSAMILSILLLMPAEDAQSVAVEILTVAALLIAVVAYIHVKSPLRRLFALRVIGGQLGSIFLVAGGASLLAQNGGGLYWVVPALLIAMVSAIIGAWVVLVEAAR